MSEKQEIIKQMMELQHKFIDLEHRGDFSAWRGTNAVSRNWRQSW